VSCCSATWSPYRAGRNPDRVKYALPSELPVVQAPMAGGPSTPELALAVADAGGFGFIAGGYHSPDALREILATTMALTRAPLGVNLFVPSTPAPRPPIEAYALALRAEADRLGAQLGEPRWDDDAFDAKVEVLAETAPHLVTFTFGCPPAAVVQLLHSAGARIGVTVTGEADARLAADAGADVLVVQGTEAGGHQATFLADAPNETPLLDALDTVREVGLPMIAAGGIMAGADAATVIAAGAMGVQIGTALLCTPEAATTAIHRAALLERRFTKTAVSRAYSGHWGRGLENRFAREHVDAPRGYPEVHHLTRPLRAAAAAAGDADVPNLWAGTGWRSVTAEPAGDIVRRIARDAARAI
jgi:nitronate monooxygenase